MGNGKIVMTKLYAFAVLMLVAATSLTGVVLAETTASIDRSEKELMSELRELPAAVSKAKPPEIKDPQWLKDKLAAERKVYEPTAQPSNVGQTVSYSVEGWGSLKVDLDSFKANALATLNDPRGWSQANVKFVEVPTGGLFTLVISEAAELERRYSPGCSAEYSCRVGRYVIINQDRWQGATPAWNSAGGGLRDYQHMVINHEVGHWLGHGHAACSGAGQPAPVMLQQSIDLQGCKFNPWPLDSELWLRI